MESSLVFTAAVIAAIAAVMFLLIRPDIGGQPMHPSDWKGTEAEKNISAGEESRDSGEREGMPPASAGEEAAQEDKKPESNTSIPATGGSSGSPGTQLIPPPAGSQSSSGGGGWNVPDPFVPDPTTTPFTTPPQPLDDVTIYAFFIDSPADDVLIDAGKTTDGSSVLALLGAINKTRAEIVIASHHADDHIGGLIPIMDALNVTWVFDSGSEGLGQTFADYLSRAQTKNFTVVRAGDTFQIAPNMTLEIIHPAAYYPLSMEKDNSIAIRLVYKDFKMLFTGDCRMQCEQDILALGRDITADILKVGDHGSANSTSEAFLNAVNATTAIIALGEELAAYYNVPSQDVLDRMTARGMLLYRTDLNGNIAITTNGISYQVLAEK
jgi:beta-lactamase superfamily II metal-dependent hydrolase